MTCEAFRTLLRDREPKSPMQDAALDAHARRCAPCAVDRDTVRRLIAALDAIREETQAVAPRASLESELLDAFRHHAALGSVPGASPVTKRYRPWLAAAAALLLAAPAGLWVARSQAPSAQGTTAIATPPAHAARTLATAVREPGHHESAPGGRVTASSAPSDAVHGLAQATAAPRGTARAKTPNTIDSAELRNARLLPVLDGATDDIVHVIRVEVPRSALLDFGLTGPLVADRDVIAADVFVSEDGTPRVIRIAEPLQVLDAEDVQ